MPTANRYPYPDPDHVLLYLGKFPVRAYSFFDIVIDGPYYENDPEKLVEWLRYYYYLQYPYTWYIHQHQAVMVNYIDLSVYRHHNGLPKVLPFPHSADMRYPYMSPYRHKNPIFVPIIDRRQVLDPIWIKREAIEDSVQRMDCSQVEEGYACTICQTEFKINKSLGVLPYCKHLFHSWCIMEWLEQQNQCPICYWPGYIDPYNAPLEVVLSKYLI